MRKFKTYMTEDEWKLIFTKNLRELLERNEMTQSSFAAYMYLTPSVISKYVNGSVVPRIGVLLRMCEVLDCELSDLIC